MEVGARRGKGEGRLEMRQGGTGTGHIRSSKLSGPGRGGVEDMTMMLV